VENGGLQGQGHLLAVQVQEEGLRFRRRWIRGEGESEGEDVGNVSGAVCHLELEEEARCTGGGRVAKDEEGEDGESEVMEWGRKIERKLEGILQAVKVGMVEQKEHNWALNAWLARVSGEAPLEIVQRSNRDVAPILTPVVVSWAGSSKVGEDYFQGLEVEVEDTRAERLLGEEILAVGSEERSDGKLEDWSGKEGDDE
jgi:hypothetical protein